MSSSRKTKLFIALLAYDSRTDILNMLSILNNIKTTELADYEVKLHVQMGDCYVDQARNHCVHDFMKSDCDEFLFVDNDLSFDADAMVRLLKLPVDIVGGAYPYRGDQEGFPCSINLDENNIPVVNKELGIIKAAHVPTGMLRIKRCVFEKLKEMHGEKIKDNKGEYHYFMTGFLFGERGFLFDKSIPDDRWYGEDVFFCEFCNRSGIQVWCEPRITFGHIGRTGRIGNFAQYIGKGGTVQKAGYTKAA
jgi:hypothetical protein